jgi:hypothetical protein
MKNFEINEDFLTGKLEDDLYPDFLVLVRGDRDINEADGKVNLGAHVLATRRTFPTMQAAKDYVKGMEFRDPIIVPCLHYYFEFCH